MSHRVEILPSALKQLMRLPAQVQIRIERSITLLSADPRPRGARKLAGSNERWRLRVGDYRVIYQIEGARLLVLVLRVGHRREVYRGS